MEKARRGNLRCSLRSGGLSSLLPSAPLQTTPDLVILEVGLTSLSKRSNYFSHLTFCSRYLDYLGHLAVSGVLRIAKFMV